jgi:hypothetical protein
MYVPQSQSMRREAPIYVPQADGHKAATLGRSQRLHHPRSQPLEQPAGSQPSSAPPGSGEPGGPYHVLCISIRHADGPAVQETPPKPDQLLNRTPPPAAAGAPRAGPPPPPHQRSGCGGAAPLVHRLAAGCAGLALEQAAHEALLAAAERQLRARHRRGVQVARAVARRAVGLRAGGGRRRRRRWGAQRAGPRVRWRSGR